MRRTFALSFMLFAVLMLVLAACGGGGGGGSSSSGGSGGDGTGPVANAGPDQSVATGSLITLDGSGSSCDNGCNLSYSWTMTSQPAGSTATLSGAASISPTFTADINGDYIISLVVNDGTEDSTSDTVTITASTEEATFLYSGFETISLAVGDYWEYSWAYSSTTNGSSNPNESGVFRISLVDSVDVNYTGLGTLTVYSTKYEWISGDSYPLSWAGYKYLAAKDGVLYIADDTNAAILFDSHDGQVYQKGFVGYFSPNRQETVSWGQINNNFITADAVVVSEPFYQPECEMVGGVQICGDEYHDYQVKEYYLPGIGFGGFHRSGTSIFSGGGYVDTFTSAMNVGLTDTNVGPMP